MYKLAAACPGQRARHSASNLHNVGWQGRQFGRGAYVRLNDQAVLRVQQGRPAHHLRLSPTTYYHPNVSTNAFYIC